MLEYLLPYLLIWKYALLVAVVGSASLWLPLPATALLMAAGAFASQGYFEMDEIFTYALVSCVAGDLLWYGISFRYGREIFKKIGLKKVLDSAKFAAIEELFSKHSASAIFTSRFLATGLGPTMNLLAGFSKTSPKKFILLDVAWEALYVVIFTGLWYVFWDQWETISSITGDVTSIFMLLVVFATLVTLAIRYKKRAVLKGTA